MTVWMELRRIRSEQVKLLTTIEESKTRLEELRIRRDNIIMGSL